MSAHPTLLRLPEPQVGPPPVGLTPEAYAERLYLSLAPLARQDEATGWSLLILCNALGTMFQLVEEWVRDTPEGIGWSLLVDLDRCPDEALPWLAQFVGVRVLPGSTPEEQRARIGSTDGFSRGTPAAMRGAAQATLTGEKVVVFRERDGGDPYALFVATYDVETPDPAATEAALLAQKPAGIVMTYESRVGQDWTQLVAGYATWNAVVAEYENWEAVVIDTPAA